jgi:predicted nuclease of predicted toxin-antitoxin system
MAKSFDKWPVNIIIVTADKDFLQLIALSKRKCFNTVAVMTKQGI